MVYHHPIRGGFRPFASWGTYGARLHRLVATLEKNPQDGLSTSSQTVSPCILRTLDLAAARQRYKPLNLHRSVAVLLDPPGAPHDHRQSTHPLPCGDTSGMTADTGATPGAVQIVACPKDGALNRVPVVRLDSSPKCGTCGHSLFKGGAVALTAATFDRHALKADIPLVIDFWAPWCGPCRTMSPNFEAAAAMLEPRVRLAKLDTEAQPAIAARYGVRSIPSLILIHKGLEIARTSGVMPTAAIVAWVRQHLPS